MKSIAPIAIYVLDSDIRLKYFDSSSIIVSDILNNNLNRPVSPIAAEIINARSIEKIRNLSVSIEYILTINRLLMPNALNVPRFDLILLI
jgi:hypothetical protein